MEFGDRKSIGLFSQPNVRAIPARCLVGIKGVVMIKILIGTAIVLVLCGGTYAADLDNLDGVALVNKLSKAKAMPLSERCAIASIRIRDNNCKPISCEKGLAMAIRAGCHIKSWGHVAR